MAEADFILRAGVLAGLGWEMYLKLLANQRAGSALPERFVPKTFLVAEVDGEIVAGLVRHRLNELPAREGGRSATALLSAHRRRGYATEILRQALIVIRSLGVDRVLVACEDDNLGSYRAIEACGGKLDQDCRPPHHRRAPPLLDSRLRPAGVALVRGLAACSARRARKTASRSGPVSLSM